MQDLSCLSSVNFPRSNKKLGVFYFKKIRAPMAMERYGTHSSLPPPPPKVCLNHRSNVYFVVYQNSNKKINIRKNDKCKQTIFNTIKWTPSSYNHIFCLICFFSHICWPFFEGFSLDQLNNTCAVLTNARNVYRLMYC